MNRHFRMELSEAETLLCGALAAGDDEAAAQCARQLIQLIGDDEAYQMALKNEVASILAHMLITTAGPSPVAPHWHAIYSEMLQRISSYLDELDLIAAHLAEHDIPVVALKNGGIVRGIYPYAACVPMGDIDLLVRKGDFRRAHAIMLSGGYTFEFRSALEEAELKNAEESGGAEYYKILPSGGRFWAELQWRPIAGRWIRPDQEPPADELINRAVAVPGTQVRLLAPEDNLLQVALHTAKHSYVRAPGLRLHTDVDRIVRFQPIDWTNFVERVRKLEVQTSVYFSLAIPKALFDTPVPDEVLNQLAPSAWKRRAIYAFLGRAGLFDPHQPKFNRVAYIIFTTLLYDNFAGLWRAVFPDTAWMQEHYRFQGKARLPFYYAVRLFDLVWRRLAT
jgi:hypothetical protein